MSKLTAQDVMTKDVTCCSAQDDLAIAVKMMEAKKIRRLPVTDAHETMVGMLSLGDISYRLSNEGRGVARGLGTSSMMRWRPAGAASS